MKDPRQTPGQVMLMAFVLLLVLALQAGCTLRTFRVDAIKSPDVAASGMAFQIVNGNPERMDADPMVKQAAGYVTTALSAKGMFEAPDNVAPNMTVEVDFGTEAPKREILEYSEAVYRTERSPGYTVYEAVTDEKGVTRMIPRYVPGEVREVFTGWETRSYTITIYPKYLRITAREVPAEGDDRPPRELWSVYVTNEDMEDDIEKTLPMLVAAAMDVVDQNASSQRTITMSEKDDRVVFIKSGM